MWRYKVSNSEAIHDHVWYVLLYNSASLYLLDWVCGWISHKATALVAYLLGHLLSPIMYWMDETGDLETHFEKCFTRKALKSFLCISRTQQCAFFIPSGNCFETVHTHSH